MLDLRITQGIMGYECLRKYASAQGINTGPMLAVLAAAPVPFWVLLHSLFGRYVGLYLTSKSSSRFLIRWLRQRLGTVIVVAVLQPDVLMGVCLGVFFSSEGDLE